VALVYSAKTFKKDSDSKIVEAISKIAIQMKTLEKDGM